jgi:hypothetical protein
MGLPTPRGGQNISVQSSRAKRFNQNSLAFEDETDNISRKVGNEPKTYAMQYPKEGGPLLELFKSSNGKGRKQF